VGWVTLLSRLTQPTQIAETVGWVRARRLG